MFCEEDSMALESLEYDRRELEAFKDRFVSAKPVTLTGNEAWKLYLKLKRLEELQEQNKELHRILEDVRKRVWSATPWTYRND